MAAGFSRQDLLEFLDFLAAKGLMKKSTATSRKAAVNTLLSILSDDEARDLRGLDIDALLQRFHNLKPHEFKPASLSVYRSRLNSSIDELERYRRDPTGFKPQIASKERIRNTIEGERKTQTGLIGVSKDLKKGAAQSKSVWEPPPDEAVETIVFPIPLRPGVIVRVSGIPEDLTPDEATKIGSVILALSGSQE